MTILTCFQVKKQSKSSIALHASDDKKNSTQLQFKSPSLKKTVFSLLMR